MDIESCRVVWHDDPTTHSASATITTPDDIAWFVSWIEGSDRFVYQVRSAVMLKWSGLADLALPERFGTLPMGAQTPREQAKRAHAIISSFLAELASA